MVSNYRRNVAQEMIDQIEAGTAPWQKPWKAGMIRTRAFNPATGKDYRGINSWWLEMQSFSDPRWLTYRQAQELDAQVLKGERGTTVEYWQWTKTAPVLDEQGKPVLDDEGNKKMATYRLERPRVFYARVFNAEQIDGLAPYVAPAPSFAPHERAEKVLADAGIPIRHDQSDRAFYRPGTDSIHLPAQAAFPEAYEYYATALHEIGHATGHPSRLNRDFGPFGSEAYAKEELRAEMASFMMTTEVGLGHYPERHAGYVQSWLKVLKDDHNLLFQAARDAELARTWVLEPEQRQKLERQAVKKRENVQAAAPSREPEQAVALASLPGTSVRLQDRMVVAQGQGSETALGGTPAIVNWAMEEGLSPADLTAVLTLQGTAAKADPSDILAMGAGFLGRDAQLAHNRPGRHAGAMLHIGARYALQDADAGPVVHDLAALDYDARSVAALVTAQQAEKPVTLAYDEGGKLAVEADMEPLKVWLDKSAAQMAEGGQPAQERNEPRVYLNVPYAERNEAKEAGAKWDKEANAWFVSPETEDPRLSQWINPELLDKARQASDALGDELDSVDIREALQRKAREVQAENPQLAVAFRTVAAEERAMAVGWDPTPSPEVQRRMQGGEKAAAQGGGEKKDRVYLAVPFAEKNRAKARGARWDRHRKAWYAPPGVDVEGSGLAEWLPNREAAPAREQAPDPVAEFAAALKEHGLVLDGPPVMDGRWHRVPVDDDAKGKKSGSYRGFIDGVPNGQIMNYKTGQDAVKWVATGSRIDPAEMERMKAESAARKAEKAQELAEQHRRVAKRAYAMFMNAADAPADHPYLVRKGVAAHGLKVDDKGNLLVPARDEKDFLWNVQVIKPDGTKRFLKDGRKEGLMHRIGGGDGPILIAEGYATAASLSEATGHRAAVGFDAGNLQKVAEALHRAEPAAPKVLAADNDHTREHNAGLAGAARAADAVDGKLIVPTFTDAEKARGLTDYNDLVLARGGDAGRKAIAEDLAAVLDAPKAKDMTKAKTKGSAPEMAL